MSNDDLDQLIRQTAPAPDLSDARIDKMMSAVFAELDKRETEMTSQEMTSQDTWRLTPSELLSRFALPPALGTIAALGLSHWISSQQTNEAIFFVSSIYHQGLGY